VNASLALDPSLSKQEEAHMNGNGSLTTATSPSDRWIKRVTVLAVAAAAGAFALTRPYTADTGNQTHVLRPEPRSTPRSWQHNYFVNRRHERTARTEGKGRELSGCDSRVVVAEAGGRVAAGQLPQFRQACVKRVEAGEQKMHAPLGVVGDHGFHRGPFVGEGAPFGSQPGHRGQVPLGVGGVGEASHHPAGHVGVEEGHRPAGGRILTPEPAPEPGQKG
jgi:hypothetical protein